MAKARAKSKAKSGSKTSKKALKKKVIAKAKSARPAKAAKKAKRPAPKKAKAPAPKKRAAAKKPAPVAAKKTAPAKKPTPAAARPALQPAVGRALAQAEVEGLISRLPPPVQPVVKTLRRLVLEAAPEASELLEDGSPSYFANGLFARIEPSERQVLVRFLKGGQLPSAGELPGEGDQRALTLTDVNELKESVLRKLVREAVMLNLSNPQSSAPA